MRERERDGDREDGKGRQDPLTAEPFIDKVVLGELEDCSWTHHTLFITWVFVYRLTPLER